MEKLINPRIEKNLWVILFSVALGIISAALAGLAANRIAPFLIIGAVTGLITGAILRRMYLKESKKT